jgi:hypothetical protein
MSFGGGGGESERKRNKEKKEIHFAFDLHNWMEGLLSELISHFSLTVKMARPLRML